MSKSLVDLAKAITEDIAEQEKTIEWSQADPNPQVQEIYLKAVARKEALEAVLHYTKTGSKTYFEKGE